MTQHLEIEKKYAVGRDFAVPSFTGVADGVTVDDPRDLDLCAVYYDTPDLRLTTNKISLRRRTGGDDEGWHLKLPAGKGRLEIQLPLDGDEPPAELASLVRAQVRHAPLKPVARISDHRTVRLVRTTSGGPVVEIADDHVTGRSLLHPPRERHWREVEVEVVGEAQPRWLRSVAKGLVVSGARESDGRSKVIRTLESSLPAVSRPRRPRTAADVVQADLRHRLTQLASMDIAVRQGLPDSVHQLRVSANRLRATVRSFAGILGPERAAALDTELAWMRALLGAARDSEVMQKRLLGLIAAQPVELVRGPVATRVRTTLEQELQSAGDRLLEGLNSERYLTLLDELDDLAVTPLSGPLATAPPSSLSATLTKGERKVRRKAVGAAALPPGEKRDAAMHRTRKAAKRLRYAADVCVPQLGKPAKHLSRRANSLQDHLGERQDSVVTGELLARLATAAQGAPGESAFTYGLLLGGERARIERLDDDLPRCLRRNGFGRH